MRTRTIMDHLIVNQDVQNFKEQQLKRKHDFINRSKQDFSLNQMMARTKNEEMVHQNLSNKEWAQELGQNALKKDEQF